MQDKQIVDACMLMMMSMPYADGMDIRFMDGLVDPTMAGHDGCPRVVSFTNKYSSIYQLDYKWEFERPFKVKKYPTNEFIKTALWDISPKEDDKPSPGRGRHYITPSPTPSSTPAASSSSSPLSDSALFLVKDMQTSCRGDAAAPSPPAPAPAPAPAPPAAGVSMWSGSIICQFTVHPQPGTPGAMPWSTASTRRSVSPSYHTLCHSYHSNYALEHHPSRSVPLITLQVALITLITWCATSHSRSTPSTTWSLARWILRVWGEGSGPSERRGWAGEPCLERRRLSDGP